jgi:RNA polymerase sigma-70 factor, ECF subfamily
MAIFAPECFAELLRQARAGSRDALGRLLEPFRDYLVRRRVAFARPGRVEFAELVQDTFHSAVRGFEQFRGESESELFAWLRQILHNRALTANQHATARKRAGGRQVSLDECVASALRDLLIDDEATPCTSNMSREFTEKMHQAFLRLKSEHQDVVTLHYWADNTFAEIAVLWGKSPEAVAKVWQRALKAWRQELANDGLIDQ